MSERSTLIIALGAFALVILQNAWLCDDAFITYRTADNLINGHGLTWNAGERVQTFTNPLWLFTIAGFYFFSGEIYYTAILLSWALSVLAVFLVFSRIANDWRAVVLGAMLFSCSKAFVDYSTSGLENPLTHLLLALFICSYINRPRDLFRLALLTCLATLNRMDTLLFFLPALAFAWWPQRSLRSTAVLALGFAPFALWEIFSILYYGFPVPNTAYAKLGAGIAPGELAIQGLHYASHSLQLDPLTLCTIIASAIVVLWKRDTRLLPLVLGLALYLLYTVRIGGGFMSGRFYAAPFFVAVALLLRAWPLPQTRAWLLAPAIALIIGLLAPYPPPFNTPAYGSDRKEDNQSQHGIGDERAFYYPYTGLLNAATQQDTLYPIHGWADWGRRLREFSDGGLPAVVRWPFVGLIGFYAGPGAHLIDIFGLGDPLLARLPSRRDEPWRIGHFKRLLPDGYFESYLYGPNLIADPQLARYHEKLKIITSGDLFSAERWSEIWKMNTGHYEHLINIEAYRHPSPEEIGRSERATMGEPIVFKPDPFMQFSGLGDIYLERREFVQAAQTYRQALDLDIHDTRQRHPEDYLEKMGALYLRLSQALIELGHRPTARTVLETFLRINPQNAIIHDALQDLQSP